MHAIHAGGTGRTRREAQDGPDVPLVSGTVVALGECRRADAASRLPGLVRPAMGAFNEWTKGSFLERPENRAVVTVAKNCCMAQRC